MPGRNSSRESWSLAARFLAGLVRFVGESPRTMLLGGGLLSVVAIMATLVLLQFQTRRSDLIDPEADFHRRWLSYIEKFPDTADLVVVVRGPTPGAVVETLDRLGTDVERRPDMFRNALFRIDRPGASPVHFISPDGLVGYLRVAPVIGETGFEGASASIVVLRELLARESGSEGIEVSLTGIPVLESDEMIRSRKDMLVASGLAAVGVAVLMLVGFRGLRLPLVILAGLAVSLAWSFGLTSVTIGHLNILSVAFAVVLIGLGVDFSIHFLARYVQARQEGAGIEAGLVESAGEVGPGIFTAAVTTALAFLCASLTEFRGVAELGWIAGAGIGLCALVTFVLLPAMVRLTDAGLDPVHFAIPLMGERWRHRVAENPRVCLVLSLLVIGGCLAPLLGWQEGHAVWRVRYDDNLLNLQAEDVPSVAVQRRIAQEPGGAVLFAVSLAGSRAEARERADRFTALATVGHVSYLGRWLVPGDPDGLARLPEALVSRYRSEGGEWLLQVFPRESIWEQEPLRRFVAEVRTVDPEVTGTPLQNFEAGRQIKRSYEQAALVALGAIIVVLLVSGLGGWRAGVMLLVAAGIVVVSVALARREGYPPMPGLWGTAFVVGAVLSAGVLDWRSLRDSLLALLPPLVGGVVMLGIMQWIDEPLNPANLIVLPLVLGIGVDDGVHVIHDFRVQPRPYVMSPSTIHGVLLTSLTSMIGFGTLLVASHRGLASLGLVLSLGVGCCLAVALVPLPAVLRLVSGDAPSAGHTDA